MYYVYAHFRADDTEGNPFYIGKGKGKRDISAKRSTYWKNIVDKHGYVSKRIAENLTEQEAWLLEVELIKKYGKLSDGSGCLCNFTDGGEGASGMVHSKETKEKYSSAKKGKTWEEIYGAEQAASMKARAKARKRIMSKETRKKISLALKGKKGHIPNVETRRKLSNARKGKPSPIKGMKFSELAKQNMSKAAKLREADPSKKENASRKLKGRKKSDKTKRKMSIAAKVRGEKMKGVKKPVEVLQKRAETIAKKKLELSIKKDV